MSIVSIVVFLGILVAVNYLGTRQNKRWDFTANQVYSLSDQTIKILKELKEPVQVTVFERNDRQDVHKDRLQEYRVPDDAAQDRIHRSRPRADARRQRRRSRRCRRSCSNTRAAPSASPRPNEQDLTNALIKVVTGAARKVYFTQGHGEKDTASTDRGGYSTAVEAMKQDNFAVEPLVLIQQKTMPADATIVVIAGPTTDFFPPEIEALNAYVAKGGKVHGDARSAAEGARRSRCSRSSWPTGASAPAPTSCSTRAAWARCSAPTRRCRSRRSIRRIRSPKASASSPRIRWRDR